MARARWGFFICTSTLIGACTSSQPPQLSQASQPSSSSSAPVAAAAASSPVPMASAPPSGPGDDRYALYCSGFAEGTDRENCWMRAAAEARHASLCRGAGSLHDDCLIGVARVTGDSSPCTDALDSYACVMAAAISAPTVAVCDPLRDLKALTAQCLRAASADTCNAYWSQAIQAQAVASCEALMKGDRAACGTAGDHKSQLCERDLAVRVRDRSLCALAGIDADRCKADVAFAMKTRAACAVLPADSPERSLCLEANASHDIGACDDEAHLADKESAADVRRICTAAAASHLACGRTGSTDCFLHFMIAVTDDSMCRGLGIEDQTCLLGVALNTREPKVCARISDPAKAAACAKLTAH